MKDRPRYVIKVTPHMHSGKTDEEVKIPALSKKIAELNLRECLDVALQRVDANDTPIEEVFFQCPKHIIVDHMIRHDTDNLYVSAWTGEKGRASSLQNTQLKKSGKWNRYISRTFVSGKTDDSIDLMTLMTEEETSRIKTIADRIRGTIYNKLDLDDEDE